MTYQEQARFQIGQYVIPANLDGYLSLRRQANFYQISPRMEVVGVREEQFSRGLRRHSHPQTVEVCIIGVDEIGKRVKREFEISGNQLELYPQEFAFS